MTTPGAVEDSRRYTISITPMTSEDLALVLADIRARWGRKHLIHVIGDQPSGTHLTDAPRECGGATCRHHGSRLPAPSYTEQEK